jgi:hypothetical protein
MPCLAPWSYIGRNQLLPCTLIWCADCRRPQAALLAPQRNRQCRPCRLGPEIRAFSLHQLNLENAQIGIALETLLAPAILDELQPARLFGCGRDVDSKKRLAAPVRLLRHPQGPRNAAPDGFFICRRATPNRTAASAGGLGRDMETAFSSADYFLLHRSAHLFSAESRTQDTQQHKHPMDDFGPAQCAALLSNPF